VPGNWEDQLAMPNRPVTNVSYFEASAYCRWLSEQRGEVVRLPTVAEWEMAATPAPGAYPWGKDEPDRERANYSGNVGAPTPVGIYPAGDGPNGHCDLAGNVMEWCLYNGDYWGALRGAGWVAHAKELRAALHIHAGNRRAFVGFRVAAGPASNGTP
jgi:formylglycine-generating enzyme required for sulfatase activity